MIFRLSQTDETEEKVVEEEDEKVKQDRDKQERIDASLRERERQVQEEMSTITKDREKEREHHRFDEAVQHYKALLTDLVSETCFLGLSFAYMISSCSASTGDFNGWLVNHKLGVLSVIF